MKHPLAPTGRGLTALILGFVLVLTGATLAGGAEPPVVDSPAGAVTADGLPTAQIDGVAWDQVVIGRTVFVGGEFTAARPAGAQPGQSTSPRSNLMSYDLVTGQMTDWAPLVNGKVRALAASPDGSRLYVGGAFTRVDGQLRSRVAAFDTATGQLVGSFAPIVGSDVFGIAVTGSAVYLGGWFGSVNGVARSRLAAVSPAGALLGWAPTADHTVYGLGVTGAGDRVVVAGSFSRLNGVASFSMGTLDAANGTRYPFALGDVLRNTGNLSAMWSLRVAGNRAYATGYGLGTGNFEGVVVADAYTGTALNLLDCHGDSYDAVPSRGLVYVVSHAHHCDNVGGFPEEIPVRAYRTTAFTEDVRGTVARNNQGRPGLGNWEGYPVGSLVAWYPDLTVGSYTGKGQAAWTIDAAGEYIVEAGEFTHVNGRAQQGLVRFATRAVTTQPRQGPLAPPGELVPTLQTRTSTSVVGSVRASYDRDHGTLTYRVLRDDRGLGDPVATIAAASTGWARPRVTFTDTDVVPGWTYTYRVAVSDGDGNTVTGAPASLTVAASDAQLGYAGHVMADAPRHYWRLGQPAGQGSAPDQVSTSGLSLGGGVTGGVPGAPSGSTDTAVALTGSALARAGAQEAEPAPASFTIEGWFASTSSTGGLLIGHGDKASGASDAHDRHLYLDDAGRVVVGVDTGTVRWARSPGTYRDGAWHHVAATVSGTGLILYVDGVPVAQDASVTAAPTPLGFWRLGGDALGSRWPGPVTTPDGAVRLDEVAVFDRALTDARIAARYALGRTPGPADAAPSAAFTSSTAALTAAVDATPSADAEGPIAAVAWDFGDGARATGTTAQHTYAAAGSYPVTLTVVDAAGQVATRTQPVTVSPTASWLARDTFSATGPGWATAEVGGSWQVAGATASRAGGLGVLDLPPGGAASAWLPGVLARDADVTTDIALAPAAGTAAFTHSVLLRRSATGTYRLDTAVAASGAARLTLVRATPGGETVLDAADVPGLGVTPGARVNVRARVVGTTPTRLAAKVWVGSTQPDAWHLAAQDGATALPSGSVGLALDPAIPGGLTASVDAFAASPPPPNAAPVALFTLSANGLAVAFDASAARDPDGLITAWSWTFGDGTTGQGRLASHTYPAAGTYTVRLTVTDDRGATASTSLPVTVTAPVAVLADDGFDRSVTGGWGTAPTGGPWSLNVPGDFTVAGGAGSVRIGTGNTTRTATLGGVQARDVSLTTTLSLDKVVAGDSYYHQIVVRQTATGLYSFTARPQPNGNVSLILARRAGGVETVLSTATLSALNLGAGEQFSLRFDVTGSPNATLRGTLWRFGAAEPAPQVSAADAHAEVQAPGTIGMRFYTGSGLSMLPLTVSVDRVRVVAA